MRGEEGGDSYRSSDVREHAREARNDKDAFSVRQWVCYKTKECGELYLR